MTNNDILRRIRYAFDYSDPMMLSIFAKADLEITREQLRGWLIKDDEDPDFQSCHDVHMATFLNGLINHRRGKKEGAQPEAEKRLTNNIIFMKLKIALNLQTDDIIEMMEQAGLHISKHELSAFFRRKGHKNYRECKDQILRNFLQGVLLKYRKSESESVWDQSKELTEPKKE